MQTAWLVLDFRLETAKSETPLDHIIADIRPWKSPTKGRQGFPLIQVARGSGPAARLACNVRLYGLDHGQRSEPNNLKLYSDPSFSVASIGALSDHRLTS